MNEVEMHFGLTSKSSYNEKYESQQDNSFHFSTERSCWQDMKISAAEMPRRSAVDNVFSSRKVQMIEVIES